MKLLAVLAVIYPLIIALILILIGVLLYLRRTKMGINTTGVVVGTAKIAKKMTKLKMSVNIPVPHRNSAWTVHRLITRVR